LVHRRKILHAIIYFHGTSPSFRSRLVFGSFEFRPSMRRRFADRPTLLHSR
jgi:hypothetical protein